MSSFYLKYRPQTLEELDLTMARETLQKIVAQKDIPHAFLFSGPKGTGKTSAARILAKVMNCENIKKGSVEPCNKCSQCISITEGNNIDIIEIDAASNRGIEDVRLLRESIKLSTMNARKKVYIVDEAHMLTTEASNALLKTLEEPPEHVMFILATTNPEKLIPTIRSRTTNVIFKKAGKEEIKRSLIRVVKKEKLKVKDGAFDVIAEFSSGSFRDAMKNLETLVGQGVELAPEEVKDYFLSGGSDNTEKLIKLFVQKDIKSILPAIGELSSTGLEMDSLTRQLLKHFREKLIEVAMQKNDTLELTETDLIKLLELLQTANSDLKNAVIETLPLEMAAIKWCIQSSNKTKNEKKVTKKNSETPQIKNEPNENENKKNQIKSEKVPEKNGKHDLFIIDAKLKSPESVANGNIPTVYVSENRWKEILLRVRSINASTEALLRAARPINHDGKILHIGVYYKFHKEQLEEHVHRQILEDAAGEIIGVPTKVVCTLTEPPQMIVEEPVIQEHLPKDGNGSIPTANREAALTEGVSEDIMKIAKEVFEI